MRALRTSWRRFGAVLLLAAFAASSAEVHRHSLFADIYEGGGAHTDHDHVLTSHDRLSRATHFHVILGTEHDSCAACHGARGLVVPSPAPSLAPISVLESAFAIRSSIAREVPLHARACRAPPILA